MRKLTTFFIISILFMRIYGQNEDRAYPHIIPMTPNTAELTKYSDYPVSYYTGTPNISIPLYEIDVDGFKLPITLKYHASGIRVDQEATWVGLGWSLDVGATISRTIMSVDDFGINPNDRNFPYVNYGYYYAPDIESNYFNQYGDNFRTSDCNYEPGGCIEQLLLCDPEPDIFYYNLPNINGKFLVDKSRGAVLFDKFHNLKIEIIQETGSGVTLKFKITDNEGNQYFFNQWERTTNYSSRGSLNKNIHTNSTIYDNETYDFVEWERIEDPGDPASPSNPIPLVTSWCLTKIITNKGREINFSYDEERQYLPTQESCENYCLDGISANGVPYTINDLYYYMSKIVNDGLRLKSIDGDFGNIDFLCSDRFDIKGTSKKLDSICVHNNKNQLIKSYKFNYSYFNENYSGNYQYEHVFKRLKLTNLTEYSSKKLPYLSTYIPLNNGYDFQYYEGDMPPKNSKNVDYWGFQNGKYYGSKYYIGLYLPNNRKYLGVKKDESFDKSIIGTIKKITYPTGGTSEFIFESNTISSGYFETHTCDNTSTQTINLPVYNDYIMHEYPDLPSQRVYNFEITEPTVVKINCYLENSWTQNDPDYNYLYNPIGLFRKISPTINTYFTFECPNVYDESILYGEGTEINLVERQFLLDSGTYEFIAYNPPKDVLADWKLYFNYLSAPTITIGTPPTPYNAGGIRIRKIITDAKTREFRYPIGKMLCEPVLYYLGTTSAIPNTYGKVIVQVSESKAPLSTFNHGNFVGYDWVEEYAYNEDDDISGTKYIYYNDTESEIFDDRFPDSPRYINYYNGLLKSIEKFKHPYPQIENRILVEKEDFTYNSTTSNIIKAFKDKGPGEFIYIPNTGQINPLPTTARTILEYYYQIEWPLLSKHVTTLFTNEGESVISEINNSYNSKDLIQSTSLKRSSDSNINLTEFIKEIKYPFDFNDGVSLGMVDKNMLAIPIVSETYIDSVKTSSQKTVFRVWDNDFIAPEIIETSKGNAITENQLKFNAYDDKGNLLEVQQENGLTICYIWGYHKTLPIAKIENITYAQIQSYIENIQNFSDMDNDRTQVFNEGYEGDLREALKSLQGSHVLSNAQMTYFTYDPLIGVTSVTDPKGDTQYYIYDEFNRLKQVIDKDGNILSENQYHYRGQNLGE